MADRVAVRSACRRPPLALATAGAYLDLHPLIAATGRLLGLAVVTEQKRTLRTGSGEERTGISAKTGVLRALFVGPQGRGLSARAVDLLARGVAARARQEPSAHIPGTRP